MGIFRIAMAQVNPTLGDLSGNADKINKAIGLAEKAKADIVLTPELALCGYPPEDMLLKPGFLRDCTTTLEIIADKWYMGSVPQALIIFYFEVTGVSWCWVIKRK